MTIRKCWGVNLSNYSRQSLSFPLNFHRRRRRSESKSLNLQLRRIPALKTEMSLSAAFGERLEQLDRNRNERLSLLQAERELQAAKSLVLESKRASMRSMEERCLRLERSLALQSLKISALESEIAALDAKYNNNVHQLRALKCEVEELEEVEKEKEGFYRAQIGEMNDFKEATNRFFVDCQIRTEESRDELTELKEKLSIFRSAN